MASIVKYKLRGGEIQPRLASCAGGIPDFYTQTFGAEKIIVDVDSAKVNLLASTDMQGQKPGNVEDPSYIASTYTSASYQGRSVKTTDGDFVFTAQEEHVGIFIEEEDLGQ